MARESETAGGRRRHALRVCALCLSLAMGGVREPAAQEATPQGTALPEGDSAARPGIEALLDYFETIVFEAEYRLPQGTPVVAKWQDPLRIGLAGKVSDLNRRTVEGHVRTLANVTGLDMQVLPPRAGGGNVDIHFLTRKEMERLTVDGVDPRALRRLAAGGGCYFLTFQSPAGRIFRSVIVVNIERDEQATHHCLLEELTQSLGLPNDSNTMRPSIFSDLDRLPALAPQDVILLRTLYDPRMLPGMDRNRARIQARLIVPDLMRPEEALAR